MKPLYPEHFQYKQLEIRDIPQENLSVYFNSVNSWMANAIRRGGKIFVHCYAGISRSATYCIAFLMKEFAVSLDSATLMV